MFQLKDEKETIEILKNLLKFSNQDIAKIKIYLNLLLEANKKHNFIGKKTENYVWIRHVLDSAQLVKHISFKNTGSLADLGSGAGFPGIILAIFNKNNNFHVKLYDKSPVKCNFLQLVVNNIKIKAEIINCNIFHEKINSRYIVSRGFKKIDKMIQVSREIIQKPHKMIILKGKSAQEELKNASKKIKLKYSLVESITSKESQIVIIDS